MRQRKNKKINKTKPCLNTLQTYKSEQPPEQQTFWKSLVKTSNLSERNQVVFVLIKNKMKDATKWIYEWFSTDVTTDAVYDFVKAVLFKQQNIKATEPEIELVYQLKKNAVEIKYKLERNTQLCLDIKLNLVKMDRNMIILYNDMTNMKYIYE